ncbi:MAG: response regulator [Myxococcota bacterium]|nr:response regulator [Myxococcota bacterium]
MRASLLLMDDDEALRDLMAETLSQDFEVTATPAVEEFLRLLERQHFDAVLCDQNLAEGMKGTAVLKSARERGLLEGTACLLLTGMPSNLGEPWLTVLRKPLDVPELVEAILRAIQPRAAGGGVRYLPGA